MLCVLCRDLVDRGADVAALFEGVVNSSLEGKGTDWDVLGAVLGAACEEGVLQVRTECGAECGSQP